MTAKTETPYLRRMSAGDAHLAYTDQGVGEPLLCIHGSWDDHHSWDGLAARLYDHFRVVTYDRRGHSASSRPPGQGRLSEDVEDALALMDRLRIKSAHIVGHSYGANVAIALARRAPEATLSLFVHEPPIFALLTGNHHREELRRDNIALMKQTAALIESGEIEQAARLFVEKVAFGRGSWRNLFDDGARRAILSNADTWLDQFRDPERLAIDVAQLRDYPRDVTLSTGSETLAAYREVIAQISDILPAARVCKIIGAGHGGHISHPEMMSRIIKNRHPRRSRA